jgi:hypothetical protein
MSTLDPQKPIQIGPDLQIEVHSGWLEAQLLGELTASHFLDQLPKVIQACRDHAIGVVLLNTTAMEGQLSTLERYQMGAQAAVLGMGLRMAMLARPDTMDPEKIGAVVARNRGLDAETFTDREKALSWLLVEGRKL